MPPAAAWSGGVDGAQAFATLAAELVRTGAELVSRDLEMAQLRQALTSRISVKGVLPASQRSRPTRGSSSSGAGAVVVAQAGRSGSGGGAAGTTSGRRLAIDDARVRVAEARAQAAEQALQAGPEPGYDPTYRAGPSPDVLAARERAPDGTISRGWPW